MRPIRAILSEAARFAESHPGHVFIGGLAVYLHAVNRGSMAEPTRDVDLMLSLVDFAELRDTDDLVSNPSGTKHSTIRGRFAFDIYVEELHALRVPYETAAAHALSFDGLRVASLEHLLVLKLEALQARRTSTRAAKDARDVITLATIAGDEIDRARIQESMNESHLPLLDEVAAGPEFIGLAEGDATLAAQLRSRFADFVTAAKWAWEV